MNTYIATFGVEHKNAYAYIKIQAIDLQQARSYISAEYNKDRVFLYNAEFEQSLLVQRDYQLLGEVTISKRNTYIATFGFDHKQNGTYVKIHSNTEEEAREYMFATFGSAWAFMYPSEKEQDFIDLYHYHLLQEVTI